MLHCGTEMLNKFRRSGFDHTVVVECINHQKTEAIKEVIWDFFENLTLSFRQNIRNVRNSLSCHVLT
jgi:hypothetical protein